MSGYTPLFNSIVTSSIWQESSSTRLVWITMLAISDASGRIEGSIPGLAHIARVSVEECKNAIELLSSPDEYSRTKENEGRRIHPIDGGWQIYNYKKFRDKAKSRAEYYREYRKEKKKNQKEKEQTKTNYLNNLNNATPEQHRATVAQHDISIYPPDAETWNNIAFSAGLSEEEAVLAYDNFKANNWKRSNGVIIESWNQVPGLLRYWRNNRGQFAKKQKEESIEDKLKRIGAKNDVHES